VTEGVDVALLNTSKKTYVSCDSLGEGRLDESDRGRESRPGRD
jgi:hypothetical protein